MRPLVVDYARTRAAVDRLRQVKGTLPTWSEVHEVRIENAQGAALQKARVRIVTYRHSVEARKGA